MLTKFAGSLLGTAIGDSLGAGFEGFGPLPSPSYVLEFARQYRGQLRYTDDTHMTIGVAESLIERRGFDKLHMANKLMENYEQQPFRGYGPGPPTVFRMVRSGVSWEEAPRRLFGGRGSFGNGAAMRVAPLALLFHQSLEELREVVSQASQITHTHPLGVEGAVLQAYAIALSLKATPSSFDPLDFLEAVAQATREAVYAEKLSTAQKLLEQRAERAEVVRRLGNSVEAFNSAPTAIFCFAKNYESAMDAIAYAISLGGDADTIGAMTGAIAGALHGEQGFPAEIVEKIEDSAYIRELGAKLYELWESRRS